MQPLQREPEGKGDRHSEVAEKAAAVALLFLQLLRKVEAAKNSLVCPAWKTSLRPLARTSMFLRSQLGATVDKPKISRGRWTGARLALQVTECGSVAGFLHGEK